MKSLMRLACLGAVAMAFVACEEDKHICTLPSFAGFRIEPTVWLSLIHIYGMECGRFGYDYGSTAKFGGFIV